jgi:hypothetical protein
MARNFKGTGCYKCGDPGHWAKECTTDTGGGQPVVRRTTSNNFTPRKAFGPDGGSGGHAGHEPSPPYDAKVTCPECGGTAKLLSSDKYEKPYYYYKCQNLIDEGVYCGWHIGAAKFKQSSGRASGSPLKKARIAEEDVRESLANPYTPLASNAEMASLRQEVASLRATVCAMEKNVEASQRDAATALRKLQLQFDAMMRQYQSQDPTEPPYTQELS